MPRHGSRGRGPRGIPPLMQPLMQPPMQPAIQPTVSSWNLVLNANLFRCSDYHLHIMLVHPGEKLCFYGAARMMCIAGSVSVDGFDMRGGTFEREKMHNVCFPYRTSRPAIFQATNVMDPLNVNYKHNRLKYRLKEITPHYDVIMKVIGDRQPAVLVLDTKLPSNLVVVNQLHENYFIPKGRTGEVENVWFFVDDRWSLYSPDSMNALNMALRSIEKKRREGEKVILMPCADKGQGKSTFVRHLANLLLKPESPPVYILDLDVGQSELTPCGSISLAQVTSPFLTPSFANHADSFDNSYFYGAVTPSVDTDAYVAIMERLLNEFHSKSEPGSTLIINTVGWTKGVGGIIYGKVIEAANPTIIVRFAGGIDGFFRVPQGKYKQVLDLYPCFGQGCYMPPNFSHVPVRQQPLLTSAALRSLGIIGYFSKMLPRATLSSLCEVVPYSIKFGDMHVVVPEDYSYVKDKDFFGTLNVQIVALCDTTTDVDMKTRRILGKDFLPKVSVFNASHQFRCYGYAMIRALDMESANAYIITPVPITVLQKVKMFVRGLSISVPQALLSSQNSTNVPYLIRSTQNKNMLSDLYDSLKQNSAHRRGYYPH